MLCYVIPRKRPPLPTEDRPSSRTRSANAARDVVAGGGAFGAPPPPAPPPPPPPPDQPAPQPAPPAAQRPEPPPPPPPVLPPLPLPFAPPAPYPRPLLPPQVGETGLAYARRGGSILAWNAMAALLELAGQPEPSLYLISGLAPPPPPLPPPPPAYDLADGSSDGVARVEPRSPPRSPAGTTLSPSPSPESPPSPAPPCSACGLAPPLCPASVPARCLTCDQAFAPGAVGYPEVQTEPAETWTPPDWPVEAGIGDGDGHPLTWGRVAHAHAWLVQHASCAAQAGGYSSDDEEAPAGCPCTLHLAPRGHRGAGVAPRCVPRLARPDLRHLLVGQLRVRLRVRRRR